MSEYWSRLLFGIQKWQLKVIRFLFGILLKVYFHAFIHYEQLYRFPWKQLSFVSLTMNMSQHRLICFETMTYNMLENKIYLYLSAFLQLIVNVDVHFDIKLSYTENFLVTSLSVVYMVCCTFFHWAIKRKIKNIIIMARSYWALHRKTKYL